MATQTQSQDAIVMLREEHREVLDAFKEFEKTDSEDRKAKLAKQICTDLTIHAMLEEELFYPSFRGKIEDDLLDEAMVEHDAAKVLIAEIDSAGPEAEYFDAKVKVLGEMIEHHIEEEEQPNKGIFAEARKVDVDLKELGGLMAARKAELQAQFGDGMLPPPEVRTFADEPAVQISEEIETPAVMSAEEQTGAQR